MAFDNRWIGGSGQKNFGTGANWHDGSAPTTTQSFLIAQAPEDCLITLGMDQSALSPTLAAIEERFFGKIGAPDDPLVLGSATKLRIRAPYAQTLSIAAGSGKTIGDLEIYRTGSSPYACYIKGPGTFTRIIVLGGQKVRLAANIVVTDLYVDGGIVVIDPLATVGNIHQAAGLVQNYAEISTALNVSGGTFEHLGEDTEGDIGTATIWGGTLLLKSRNGTIDNLHVKRGGLVDGTQIGHENSISAGSLRAGGVVRLNMSTVITSSFKNYGGQYSGPSGIDQPIPPQAA